MIEKFVPAIREILKDGGYTKVDSNKECGGEFLVGVHGRLFKIQGDFQVSENVYGFNACGCGEYAAMASMMTQEDITSDIDPLDPERRIIGALSVAVRIHDGVRQPFNILKI